MVIGRMTRSEEVERSLLDKMGELADANGQLPTEAELAQMFSVSRGTIRSAIGSLVARGLLVRRQGLGTFINQIARIANPLDQALDFCEIISRNGSRPSIRYVAVSITRPAANVIEALRLSNEQALQRHTIFMADGDPVIYCINTIPVGVLPASVLEELIVDPSKSEPIYVFLEQQCGQRVEFHTASLWSDLAQNCDMREPICDPHTPVLVIEETGYNTTHQPVFHSLEYYPGRFMRFELIRKRMTGAKQIGD